MTKEGPGEHEAGKLDWGQVTEGTDFQAKKFGIYATDNREMECL